MTDEEWRPVVGFEDRYEVSNRGRVRSLPRRVTQTGRYGEFERTIGGRLMNAHLSKGYRRLSLRDERGCHLVTVHRLVAMAFLGPPPFADSQVAHGDGVRVNNNVENLRWASAHENAEDRVGHGTSPVGKANPRAILTDDDIREIRRRYVRKYGAVAALARDFGVSNGVISHIVHRRTWNNI